MSRIWYRRERSAFSVVVGGRAVCVFYLLQGVTGIVSWGSICEFDCMFTNE